MVVMLALLRMQGARWGRARGERVSRWQERYCHAGSEAIDGVDNGEVDDVVDDLEDDGAGIDDDDTREEVTALLVVVVVVVVLALLIVEDRAVEVVMAALRADSEVVVVRVLVSELDVAWELLKELFPFPPPLLAEPPPTPATLVQELPVHL